jgi:Na+-driven multidrug efflux pump
MDEQRRDLTQGSLPRTLIRMALPILAGMTLNSLYSLVDGSGHTRPVMVISLLRQWGMRVPMALILGFVAGWGSLGIYGGLAAANVIAAVVTWMVFSMGTWAHAVVAVRAETPDSAAANPETAEP